LFYVGGALGAILTGGSLLGFLAGSFGLLGLVGLSRGED
jgi:hypothetical protein